MCGIIGYVGKNKRAQEISMNGLKILEYRGYDSAGLAYYAIDDNKLHIIKEKGHVEELEKKLEKHDANIGIGHTRWATNGIADEVNSHPHKQGKITIVHNGIFENYKELKKQLIAEGIEFKSETDTEVAAALLNKIYNKTNSMEQTLIEFQKQVTGDYALGIINDDDYETLYAIRNESPLFIGLGENENYITSDILAVLKYTSNYTELENGDFAKIKANNIQYFDKNGDEINKETKVSSIKYEDIKKDGFETFMLKEIFEQSKSFKNTVFPYIENGIDSLMEKMPDFSKYDRILILGCGSAMHAGLVGKNLIEEYADIPVDVEIASDFNDKKKIFINNKTLVIGISQSGETADTIKALKRAKERGTDTLGIINRQGSMMTKIVDYVLYTNSGFEVAVATTKAYSAQIALLSLIALNIANHKNNIDKTEIAYILKSIKALPKQIDKLLTEEYCNKYKEIANNIYDKNNIFFLGRGGIDYSLAMEGSLKLREITYINSSAYSGGELKHGTISLVDDNTPIINMLTDKVVVDKMLSNMEETRTRGAKNYLITTKSLNDSYHPNAKDKIIIDDTHELLQPILSIIPFQMLAYYVSRLRDVNTDKPRNLAKSVTVI